MNASSDVSISQAGPGEDPAGRAPADTAPVAAPPKVAPLSGASMVAAYRAARAAQRSELRANLQQSHLARRRSRAERLGLDPSCVVALPPLAAEAGHPPESEPGSVFANLVSLSEGPVAGGREPAPASCVEADHTNEAPVEAAEQQAQSPQPGSAPAPQAAAERAYDPPLAEIGFGPGMLIRLSQLGLHTTGDLAQADAGELRAALGDISRLVDVETWISNARQTARAG